MTHYKTLFATFAFVLLCAFSQQVWACACCIDPGYYELSVSRLTSNDLFMYEELKFDTPANIYESAAGFDGIRGLNELRRVEERGDQFELSMSQSLSGRIWRFTIRSSTGQEGTLTMPLPRSMTKFKVDIHDNEPGTEPGLYKEFRFKGQPSAGTGMFRKDIVKGTSYFLMFQGRGNGCDSSSDFTHWRLELNGPRADYAIYGKLVP